jgi:outer membrane receptor for ferrienterochelin and colicin
MISLIVLLCTVTAMAQVQNGQFSGTVTDPSGASVANAKVTITNQATNLSVTVMTSATGTYTANQLPIGTYKLTVEAPGFKTFTDVGVVLNAGTIAHVDAKMILGQTREVVEVTGQEVAVNTEDSKLASTVSSTQIANLPLNGRNVFDLMQLAPGAVNVNGVDFENGHGTVVNGVREDFNGFLINGVSNKGLSGGAVNVPIEDSVEEFQQLQLNMSAQYGNSAGGTVNLVTKAGTNAWHGSLWEYLRNDALDATPYFLNHQDPKVAKPALRFNQFGATVGGPIIKDKLFFFLSLQGDRFNTIGTPVTNTQETQAFRDAVMSADAAAGLNSTSALLYHDFVPANAGAPVTTQDCGAFTADCYFGATPLAAVPSPPNYSNALCLDDGFGGFTNLQHQKLVSIFGVTAQDQADMTTAGCSGIPSMQEGAFKALSTLNRSTIPIQESSVATFKSQTQTLGNLFNGNEASLRVDYNWNASNRFFLQYNYNRQTDKYGACNAACTRGFSNPLRNNFPQGSLSFDHTFGPSVLNEFRVGYLQNNTKISTNHGGVPAIGFADGSSGFGSYNGYPQSFKENIYTYSDLVSISHKNHNIKIGVDFRRNIENSEFNVARPSYYFYDQVFFAADAPYYQAAGVDPGICKAPCTTQNQAPQSQLSSNFRHWRNVEFGAFFQDDWKVTKRLTLNLGMRYDLYQRHHELNNLATTFLLGSNTPNSQILGGSNGVPNRLFNASDPNNCANAALAQLAGGCGPGTGGFAPSATLGTGDHNNFGPRVGFAWDVFGDGRTSLRGGFGVAYEGTLYNPLSNSRWDPPYYSFNGIGGGVGVVGGDVVYGPSVCGLGVCNQDPTQKPSYTGAGTNPNMGPQNQAQAQGNINGWDSNNPNFAVLTGIVFPTGLRDPYVYNYYMSIQREILPKTIVQFDYVGTTGHKLFRAEDINRESGSLLPAGATVTDNFGRTLTGLGGRLNGNFGRLRNWQNGVNSNYNSLQASVKHQMSHGLLFNVNYTYSHSIDEGSTWHSGATTANGAAAGEGFTTDQTLPGLDRGDSVYDIRHRLVLNYVYQLPGQNLHGVLGAVAGGWSYNGIWAMQSGAHWEPYTSSSSKLRTSGGAHCTSADVQANDCFNLGGDYNLDGGKNDRPNSSVPGFSNFSRNVWENGWYTAGVANQANLPTFSTPCLGCAGNLGRNTFVGPGQWYADMTLSKTFKFTERVNLKFDAAAFNIFNRANFLLATAGGGAHNKPTAGSFGKAAGTLNARNMQIGLKLSF